MKPITTTIFPDHIAHGFFTRLGGVSEGIYASLNCGPGTNDVPDNVTENRARVTHYLGAHSLNTLYQEHTATCLYIDRALPDRPVGDALVTEVPGVAIACLSADCAPILFYGEKADRAPIIGAAHAGWGGALKGIQSATVHSMVEHGARLETIRAAIGPCIAQVSYEVKEAFARPFLIQDDANEQFFMAGRDGHLQFDLAGYNALRLALAGVKSVVITGEDTYRDEARFFSFRRATHREEPDYGRQISAIVIKP